MNRPIALVCYICGREFGTHSLGIHIKACQKKWENQQSLKPPKQRRPCPRPPQGFDLTTKGKITKDDINKFNAKSYDNFVEEALVQCEYCGRRFNEKSLVPHQKACKTHPMIRKPYVNKGPLGKIPEEQPIGGMKGGYNNKIIEEEAQQMGNLVPCRNCGRKFNADRVGKHERVCQGERVEVKSKKQVQMKQQSKPNMKPNFGKQKKPKWKIQHQELQNAMKMMRQMKAYQAKGGKLSDLPPPVRSNYDHYVECRYCGRKYAPDVAERHIPKCANIVNKPGGIKPSKIQQKYIGGTGSGTKNNDNYNPIKPNLNPTKTNTSSNSYVKPPANSNPFGDPYPKPSSSNYQQHPSTKPNLSSPFEKGNNSKGLVGKVASNPVKTQQKSNYLKPNLNSRSTNPSNYW